MDPARIAYRMALVDAVRAARDLAGASTRMAEIAVGIDPTGEERDDPGAVVLIGDLAGLLRMVAATAPGLRAILAQAVVEEG
jgi:hypothetical protein